MFTKLKKLFQRKHLIYEYRASWYINGRSEPIVAQGDARYVERFFTRSELCELFGGYVVSVSPYRSGQFLGVWGRRNASRFRRMLRERGAVFDISRDAPELRLKVLASGTEVTIQPG